MTPPTRPLRDEPPPPDETLRASLAVAEQAAQTANEERATMERSRDLWKSEVESYEEKEANCCPEDVGFPEYIAALTKQRDALRRMLETSTVRLGILRDRMEACDDGRGGQRHDLSLQEIPAWIEEQTAFRARPDGEGTT